MTMMVMTTMLMTTMLMTTMLMTTILMTTILMTMILMTTMLMTTMLITMIVMIFRARSCTRHLGKAFFSQRVIDGFSFNFITSSLVSFPIYGFKTKKHNCFQHPRPALIKTIKCILYITSVLIRCATSSYSDDVDRNVQHRCSA